MSFSFVFANCCTPRCSSVFLLLTLLVGSHVKADEDLAPRVQVHSQDEGLAPDYVAVPFIFSTESLSTAVGAAGVIKHAGQQQASLFAIGLGTANDSWVTYLAANDYLLPGVTNWLFSAEAYRGHYSEGIYYLTPPEGDAPTRVVTQGDESFAKLHLKYVLPWGRGADGAAASLRSANSDSLNWNPLTSGVSSVELTSFYSQQSLQGFEFLPESARGLELELAWDNRDNRENSKRGGRTSLTVTRDWGSARRQSWTTWEFEQSLYLSFGQSDWFDSRVLAANVYLADTPTWNDLDEASQLYHRPPGFAGVSLGGFNRLRGYSGDQFTGRSALLYAAEYRLTPKWQPLQTLPVFRLFDIPWWQWTVFAEAGNVSDEFSLDSLHSQMKTTLGAGIRFEVEGVVVRTDLAFGDEEGQFWVMVNQPF